MAHQIYQKHVRDRIPEMIDAEDKACVTENPV